MPPGTEILGRCPLCGVYDGIEGDDPVFTAILDDGCGISVTDDLPERIRIDDLTTICGCCGYSFPLAYLFTGDYRLLQSPVNPQLFDPPEPFQLVRLATTASRSGILMIDVLRHGPVITCEFCSKLIRPGEATVHFGIIDSSGSSVTAIVHDQCSDGFDDMLYYDGFRHCDGCGVHVIESVADNYSAGDATFCPSCYFSGIPNSHACIRTGEVEVFRGEFDLHGRASEEGFLRANARVTAQGLKLELDVGYSHDAVRAHAPRGMEAYLAAWLMCSGLTVIYEDQSQRFTVQDLYLWVRPETTDPTPERCGSQRRRRRS